MSWNLQRTTGRVRKAWNDYGKIVVKPLVREVDLNNLPLEVAYEVDGVHVYVDVPNADALLGADGVRDHQRLLRFLHIFMRVAHLVFHRTDAVKVDLQNTRLHFVVFKPYDSEKARIHIAVAIAALLREALLAGNALHEELDDAKVVIGVESGTCLAVRNGTRGDRDPLFLGDAANNAAKLIRSGAAAGIYLGRDARRVLGGTFPAGSVDQRLSDGEIAACVKEAALGVTKDDVSKAWDLDRKEHPLSEFAFARWTPPLKDADLTKLGPPNSKRQEMAILYADVDGFTAYVRDAINHGKAAEAVRLLHVIRKELRDVLNDFDGRKIRCIGDCVQGMLAEGTAHTNDDARTAKRAIECVAALRSSFEVILEEIPAAKSLGLQIGVDLGTAAVSAVGVRGSRDRCAVGQVCIAAETEQRRCGEKETAIGDALYKLLDREIARLFGPTRRAKNLDYDTVACIQPGAVVTVPGSVRPRSHAG